MQIFPDFRDLLAAFESARVRYVVIGGYAVIFHGRPRATKDIDLLVALDADNRQRLVDALTMFGASQEVVDGVRGMTLDEVVFFGISPLRVDILGSASGIEFESAFAKAILTTLDGVSVRIISLDDLIVNKKASGRPRDIEDSAELERIRDRK